MRLIWLSGAFIVGAWLGVGSGGGWVPPGIALFLWIVATAMLVVGQRISRRGSVPALIVLFLLLGVARIGMPDPIAPPENLTAGLQNGSIELIGVLESEPAPYGSATRLPLTVISVTDPDQGPIRISSTITIDVLADRLFDAAEPLRSFRYGDTYRVTGQFRSRTPDDPDEEFPPGISPGAVGVITSGAVRLIDSNSGNAARRRIADIRGAASASILKSVPGDSAGLATAVTTGDRTGLEPGLKDNFRSAGLSHLLAISGLHVAIVGGLALALAARVFGRQRQLYLLMPLAAVVAYAALAGMSPSVTRAAVMASVFLLAIALGRQRSVLPAIAFAGAAMILLEPQAAATLSFQLSFTAVLGIAVIEPRLRRGMDAVVGRLAPEGRLIRQPVLLVSCGFGISLAATIATTPLVGSTFDQVPFTGAFATALALPSIPALIVASGSVAVIEPLSSVLAAPFGWIAWLSAEWVILVARAFASVPGGTVSTEGWGAWLIVSWYGTLFGWLGWKQLLTVARSVPGIVVTATSSPRFPGRRTLSWLAVPLVAVAILPWIAVTQLPGDRLKVTFFETDRGDMILVETPEGRTALIDGGRDVDGAVQALGDALPFWERNVDVMVLTHSDADHVGGLIEVLGRYDVGAVIDTTASTDTDVFEEWRRRLSLRVGPVVESRAGMVVDLGSGVTLETIWAGTPELSETNAASTVMMLRYGKVSMLLTGDIPQSVESRLLDGDATLAADLLKAPHHGSDSSSSVAFLEAVAPSIIVVSVGERNPFGHPDDDVLARYAEVLPGAPVFVTQDHGDVTVESDGARLWVETERQLL